MDLFLLLTSKLAKFHQNRGWVGKKVYQLAWNYPHTCITYLNKFVLCPASDQGVDITAVAAFVVGVIIFLAGEGLIIFLIIYCKR